VRHSGGDKVWGSAARHFGSRGADRLTVCRSGFNSLAKQRQFGCDT